MCSVAKLAPYLKAVRDTPFEWGRHDCLVFTNTAWREMYGRGWADDWLGRYMQDGKLLSRSELQKEYGFKTFTAAVNARLQPVKGVPPRGALVTTRKAKRWAIASALGISVGTKAAFVSKVGIVYHPIETITNAWIQE